MWRRWACWWWWWWLVAAWAWAGTTTTTTSSAANTTTTAAGVRTNVVAEVPGLDVGPLVAVLVALGDTARLPCQYPRPADDTVSLVLWYLNHTSRPFLSFDARADVERGGSVNLSGDGSDSTLVSRDVSSSSSSKGTRKGVGRGSSSSSSKRGGRVRLERGGTALVVEQVGMADTAEYRCRVHYRLSPSWTQRLLLTVHESVAGLELVDGAGRAVKGATLGPFSEGHTLRLACRAHHGGAKVVSLVWLVDGVEIDSSWEVAGAGVVTNQLDMGGLQHHHHHTHLTCRLTTHAHTHVAANITDVSTTITMFHVPEASITAWGTQVTESETGYLVTVGSDLTFLCTVTAHPPAYNVTWLHNGRVVSEGGRRWRRDDWQLQISQVRRSDAGLYTCLASNTEGDGHSNALLLHVAHPPQCQDSGEQQVVVAVNSSVTLTCRMDALPAHLTFTWTLADPPSHHQDAHSDLRGGIITGDAPPPHHPGLIDLTPGHPPGAAPSLGPAGEGQDAWGEHLGERAKEGTVLEHQVNAHDSRRSSVTLTPTSPAQVFCYARNSVGRTTIPCTYLLSLVDPPQPLRDCNVTVVGLTRVEVKCHDLAPLESDQEEMTQVHHAPGISFVRSSGVRPSTNLEVWSEGTLVANVSSARPELSVDDLPPDTPLQLVLYAVTPHARSKPLRLHARTPPRPSLHLTEPSTTVPARNDLMPLDDNLWWGALDGTVGGVVGGLLGGMGVLVLLLTLAVVVVRLRHQQGSGGGGGAAMVAGDEGDPHATSNTTTTSRQLHHDLHHSLSHSSLNLESRASVYCVGGSGEERGGDTPWQETSITPLVGLTTPLTPPPDPQVSTHMPEDTCTNEAV